MWYVTLKVFSMQPNLTHKNIIYNRVHQIYKGLLIMRNSLHLGYHFVRLVIKTPQKKFHAFPKILKGANGAAKIRHFEKN